MITKKAVVALFSAENGSLLLEGDKLSLSQARNGNMNMYLLTDDEWTPADIVAEEEDGVFKKVIASTDNALALTRPSIRFIKKYIELYNKGKQMEYVYVEYTTVYKTLNPYKDDIVLTEEYEELLRDIEEPLYVPRINVKNNTLVIRKKANDVPKDILNDILLTFTESLAVKLNKEDYTKDPILFKSLPEFITNWIEEKL